MKVNSLRIVYVVLTAIFFCACTQSVHREVDLANGSSQSVEKTGTTVSDPSLRVPTQSNAIEKWQLENGLTILFLKNQELPLVSGVLYMRGGSLWETPQEIGLSGAMGDQLRQGGAGNFSADALDIKLETLAASIGSNFGQEFGKVSFGCLASNLSEVFHLFADVVRRPRFESARLHLWKAQRLEEIRRRTDDPSTIAAISFNQLLYGPTPYGRVLVEDDVDRITKAGLLSVYQRFVRPDQATLAVTGMIERAELELLIQQLFGDWPRGEGPGSGAAPPVDYVPQSGIYFIEQPLAQSTVYMGQQGVARLTPDYMAIDAFNSIFASGGFGSLLMRSVRSELGLAYAIYGGISPGVVRGKNYIVLQTKSESTVQAIEESLRILSEMQQVGVLNSDLEENKRAIENSFVFNFETPDNVINRVVTLALLGYPADYDETYVPGVLNLSVNDIQMVAQKRWNQASFVVVVVGDETSYNELVKASASPVSRLHGFPVRKVHFEQKLMF